MEQDKKRSIFDSYRTQGALSIALAAVIVWGIAPKFRQPEQAQDSAARAQVGTNPAFLGPQLSRERPRGILPVEAILYLLRPSELGVTPWEVGQFANYRFTQTKNADYHGPYGNGDTTREVRAEVVREVGEHDAYAAEFGMPFEDQHWLRLEGMRAFRDRPVDVFRLASPHSLRVSDANPIFTLHEDYFPMRKIGNVLGPSAAFELRDLGEEMVEAGASTIVCQRFELLLPSPKLDEEPESVGHLWLNTTVGPLGVVRLEAKYETLQLLSYGTESPSEYAGSIAPLIEGYSTLADFCHSCHGDNCHEQIDPPH